MKGTVERKYKASVAQSRADLVQLTSGAISTKQLQKMGHPYGRGFLSKRRAAIRPSPINAQTGVLRRGIYMHSAGGFKFRMGSGAPYAKYQFSPFGTRQMVRRGVFGGRKVGGQMGEIEKRWRARLKGIRQGLKQSGRQ